GDRRLPGGRHVRQLLHGLQGRQDLDLGLRAAVEAHLSLGVQSGGPPVAVRPIRRTSDTAGAANVAGKVYRITVMADVALQPRATRAPIREATAWDQLRTNRNWLGFWFMLPAMGFLIFFLAYPLGLGIWLSFTDARIGRPGVFVGSENYEWLWGDSIFWLSVFNTLLYTF